MGSYAESLRPDRHMHMHMWNRRAFVLQGEYIDRLLPLVPSQYTRNQDQPSCNAILAKSIVVCTEMYTFTMFSHAGIHSQKASWPCVPPINIFLLRRTCAS